MQNDLLAKFLPDVLTRQEMPEWFIHIADSRSKGRCEFIVWDHEDEKIIHADFWKDGEFHETKTFQIKLDYTRKD